MDKRVESLSEKMVRVFSTEKRVKFGNSRLLVDNTLQTRITWEIRDDSNFLLCTSTWRGFPNIEEAVDDCLKHVKG